jgi:hypothetical protein
MHVRLAPPNLLVGILAAIAGLTLVPVVGEFFVELARERGFYDHPSERVLRLIGYASDLSHHPLFPWIAGGMVGASVGSWVAVILRTAARDRGPRVTSIRALDHGARGYPPVRIDGPKRLVQWSDYDLFLSYGVGHLFEDEAKGRMIEDPDFHNRKLIRIWSFRLVGQNISSDPLQIRKCYLRSLISGEIIAAKIDDAPVEEIEAIPPSQYFHVEAQFPVDEKFDTKSIRGGLAIPPFRRRFSNFTFVLETDNGRIELEYDAQTVDRYLLSLIQSFEWGAPGEIPSLPRKDKGRA